MPSFQDTAYSLRCIIPRYAPLSEREDYAQEALIAAWKAEKTYDPGRGAGLRTYTAKCISSALLRYREWTGFVRIPSHQHTLYRKVTRITKELTSQGKCVTLDVLSDASGIPKKTIKALLTWFQAPVTLDASADEENGLMRQLKAPDAKVELQIGVAQLLMLADLTYDEYAVIQLRFWGDMLLPDIARETNVSYITVIRRMNSALAKLRRFEEFRSYLEDVD